MNNNAGDAFCAGQGLVCVDAQTMPCIRCEAGSFSTSSFGDIDFLPSSRSSTPPSLYICGNGIRDPGEECDDGNLSDRDACSTLCEVQTPLPAVAVAPRQRSSSAFVVFDPSRPGFNPLFCGNGRLDTAEDCDIGAQNSDLPNASCRTDCTLSRCGDQILDSVRNEQCDDGNPFNGDGCSDSCAIEQFAGQPDQVLPGSLIEMPFVPGTQIRPTTPTSPLTDSGPETVAIMAAGASAGYTWMKMRRKVKKTS